MKRALGVVSRIVRPNNLLVIRQALPTELVPTLDTYFQVSAKRKKKKKFVKNETV